MIETRTLDQVAFPTIHLNGTPGSALKEQYTAALRAVRGAIDTLERDGPNERDYYPQEGGSFNVARAEHLARLEALRAVRDELYRLQAYVDGAMQERRLRREARRP